MASSIAASASRVTRVNCTLPVLQTLFQLDTCVHMTHEQRTVYAAGSFAQPPTRSCASLRGYTAHFQPGHCYTTT